MPDYQPPQKKIGIARNRTSFAYRVLTKSRWRAITASKKGNEALQSLQMSGTQEKGTA